MQAMTSHHPAAAEAYIRHQWALVPIPPGTKGPNTKGWNRPENAVRDTNQIPSGAGMGLAHAWSQTMALDVDEWDRAVVELAEHGISLPGLFEADNAVTINSGRAGHGKLLYRMPDGLILPSKKLIDQRPDGSKYNYLDFRCGTSNGATVQDVLPPTTHPDTKQPYTWGGLGKWENLPLIPPELLAYWQSLLQTDAQRTIPTGQPLKASWNEINHALGFITPDIDRDNWVAVGMALHWAGQHSGDGEAAFWVWHDWSAGPDNSPADKYPGAEELQTIWRSFRPDQGRTVATLFGLAKAGGWRRPQPSPLELFGPPEEQPEALDIFAAIQAKQPAPDLLHWPEILRRRADEVSASVGCDVLVPLLAGLSAVSAVAHAGSTLTLKAGFKVRPIIWLMAIGDPGAKKTPGADPMLAPLVPMEMEHHEQHDRDLLDYDAAVMVHETARAAYLEYQMDGERVGNEVPPEVPDAPRRPQPLRLKITDITTQKVVKMLESRPEGLLCHLDEMASWIRKATDPRTSDDRSVWTQSHNGGHYALDRVGSGSISIENMAISIYGNVQPRVLKESIERLSQDGLLQRFLPVTLRRNLVNKGDNMPEFLQSGDQWDSVLRGIHALGRRHYQLSPEAYGVFDQFRDWYDATLEEENVLMANSVYLNSFAKLEGQVGRIAFLFHLLESPLDVSVTKETMRRACDLMVEFIVPSMRYVYGEVAGLTKSSLESWVAHHLLTVETETISLSSLKKSARRQIPTGMKDWDKVTLLKDVMQVLEEYQWVIKYEEGTNNHVMWMINPAVRQGYEQQRAYVQQLRARRRK